MNLMEIRKNTAEADRDSRADEELRNITDKWKQLAKEQAGITDQAQSGERDEFR